MTKEVVVAFKEEGCNLPNSLFGNLSWRFTLALAALALTGCGPRRVNVVYTPQQTLMTIGYSADRSQSIFRANDDAQEYCERRAAIVLLLKQETIYQGHYNEDVTQAARTAGRVAGALGSPKGAAAG